MLTCCVSLNKGGEKKSPDDLPFIAFRSSYITVIKGTLIPFKDYIRTFKRNKFMQSYKENTNLEHIRSISGYAWLILVINQDEVGARLGLTKAYVKHIPMFKDYLDLQRDNNKKTWIYRYLGEKYGMHQSSVKRVILNILRVTKV